MGVVQFRRVMRRGLPLALRLAVAPPLREADLPITVARWLAVAFTLATGTQYLLDGVRAASITGG